MGGRDVKDIDVAELRAKLATGKYSILRDDLGANKLRVEMQLVGLVCRAVVWGIYRTPMGDGPTLKRRTVKMLEYFFPVTMGTNDYHPSDDAAIVFYFNHQSLFEVLAMIWFVTRNFPNKRKIFPVNLPWFEALCPVIGRLEELGIYITPMITPNTYKKLRKIAKDDKRKRQSIELLKTAFEVEYGRMVKDFAANRDIVAVAPSATRTEYIFPSEGAYCGDDAEAIKKMPRTMLAITLALRSMKAGVDFVPFVATRLKRAGRGLNLWRRHDVYVGAAESLEVLLGKFQRHTLDFDCYHRLAAMMPEYVRYPRVIKKLEDPKVVPKRIT